MRLGSGNSFSRSVALLAGGTVFAQGLAAAAIPVLTRLYSPQHFDVLAVFTAIVAFLGVAACLRFNVAVPLPTDDETAADLLILALVAAVVFSSLCALAVVMWPEWLADSLGQSQLAAHSWLIPLGLLLAAVYDSLQHWAIRKKRFGLVTRTRITRAVGSVGTQVSIGVVAPSTLGLIFGQVLYYGLGVFGIFRSVLRSDRAAFATMSCARVMRTARDYQRYPRVSVAEAILNSAGSEIPVVLIAAVAAGPEAGFLMLAMKALGTPMSLVGSSVSQVFFVTAPVKQREKKLLEFTNATVISLIKWGGVPLILIGFTAPITFPIVFGSEWARAGEVAAWLTPCFVLQLVASPVSMVLHVTGHLLLSARLQAFGAVLRVGSVAGASFVAPQLITEVFAVASAFYYGAYIVVIFRVIRGL